MIEPIADLPEGVIGFRAVGTIDAADYRDVLVPSIEAVLAEHEHVNVVAVLGDDFDHLSIGAMWEDAKLVGLIRRGSSSVDRPVTDQSSLRMRSLRARNVAATIVTMHSTAGTIVLPTSPCTAPMNESMPCTMVIATAMVSRPASDRNIGATSAITTSATLREVAYSASLASSPPSITASTE